MGRCLKERVRKPACHEQAAHRRCQVARHAAARHRPSLPHPPDCAAAAATAGGQGRDASREGVKRAVTSERRQAAAAGGAQAASPGHAALRGIAHSYFQRDRIAAGSSAASTALPVTRSLTLQQHHGAEAGAQPAADRRHAGRWTGRADAPRCSGEGCGQLSATGLQPCTAPLQTQEQA